MIAANFDRSDVNVLLSTCSFTIKEMNNLLKIRNHHVSFPFLFFFFFLTIHTWLYSNLHTVAYF